MSYQSSRDSQRPTGRRESQNAFAALAADRDTDFVMDEVERGGEREPGQIPTGQHPLPSNRESNWHRTGGWGSGETGTTGTWGGEVRNEQHTSVARQSRPLPPQGRAFSTAAPQNIRREPPPASTATDRDRQPVQWTGNVFQNTLGGLTPQEIREGRGRHRPPPRPVSPVDDDRSRRRHRQPSPDPNGLVARLRAAGIDTQYERDDDIPRGARFVMEDMLFHLQQKAAEVIHLQKKVDHLQEDSRVRKRVDSDEHDLRPTKRREHSVPSADSSRGDSMSRPPPPANIRAQPPVEARERPAVPPTAGTPLAPTATSFEPALSAQATDVVMRDDRPRPPSPPPRRAREARHPKPPKPATFINNREYELGVKVTPPGSLTNPTVTPDPFQPAPAVIENDDDPYDFDVSDHSSADEIPPPKKAYSHGNTGRVPDFWGVVYIHDITGWERDNSFRGMLSPNVYHSPRSNMVFTGQSAINAYDHERRRDTTYYVSQESRIHIYNVTERGIPRRPSEVDKLISIVNGESRYSLRERAEAFMLLRELHRIASRVIPAYRDSSMNYILTGARFNPNRTGLPRNSINPSPLVEERYIPRPVPPTALASSMVIDDAAFSALLHNHPGSLNSTVGVAFDYAMRVERRSVFGYSLSRLISPAASAPAFRRQFAFLVSLPRRYREAIVEYDRSHPHSPFSPQVGPDFIIHRARIPSMHAANVSLQDVINVLLDNRIPPSWIDHAYPYGFIFMDAHHTGSPAHREMIDPIDHERLERVRAYGLPPTIPSWDGWRTPSSTDILRVHLFRATEDSNRSRGRNHSERDDHSGQRAIANNVRWLLVGTDGVNEHLANRPPSDAASYAASHPITLPDYPELAQLGQSATSSAAALVTSHTSSTNVDLVPSTSSSGLESTNVEPVPSSAASDRIDSPIESIPASTMAMPTNVDMAASSLSESAESSEVIETGSKPTP